MLRTWEAEFPDLGVAGSAQGARVYRKADVERVLKLKHLILVEGLTLAGARRKMTEASGVAEEPDAESLLPQILSADVKNRILEIRRGLESLLAMLSSEPGSSGPAAEFALQPQPDLVPAKAAARKRKK